VALGDVPGAVARVQVDVQLLGGLVERLPEGGLVGLGLGLHVRADLLGKAHDLKIGAGAVRDALGRDVVLLQQGELQLADAAGLLRHRGFPLLDLPAAHRDARVGGRAVQDPVEDHGVQRVPGEAAGLGDGLLVLLVVLGGGLLGVAHLVDPVLQLGDGDAVAAHDGRGAGVRVVAAGGEEGDRGYGGGGEDERGAAATAAVQGGASLRRVCASVHKVRR
jgi:hypothetical protein